MLIGPTQEDDVCKLRLACFPKRTSGLARRAFVCDGMRLAMCRNETVSSALKMRIGTKTETPPNRVLPAPIEGFDFGLEASFSRRGKDGRHSETKAAMDESAKTANVAMRTLKNRVIIKLCIKRAAVRQPVLLHSVQAGRKRRAVLQDRTHGEAPPEGYSSERVKVAAACQGQPFHKIEGIELILAACQFWQIPAGRRSRVTHPTARDQTVSLQNAVNRTFAREHRVTSRQCDANGCRSVFTQGGALAQLTSDQHHGSFEHTARMPWPRVSARSALP